MADTAPEIFCDICEKGPFKNAKGLKFHKLKAHREEGKPALLEPQDRETLLPWHITALAHNIVYGTPFSVWCEKFRGGKGKHTLAKIRISPAGKSFAKKVEELYGDPVSIVKMLIETDMVNAFMDALLAREWARDAKDYNALHRMVKEITLKPIVDASKEQITPKITINLGNISNPEVKSSFEVVEADVVEDD